MDAAGAPVSGRSDVVVIGAGIVGLGIARAALDRGLSVTVIDRGSSTIGATVRNFGHVCVSPQTGPARDYGLAARELWLKLSRDTGFWLRESGTYVAARHADEMALIEQYAAETGAETPAEMLDADAISRAVPLAAGVAVGGAWLSADLQVNPREAAATIAAALEARGARFLWRTTAGAIRTGSVDTSRGRIDAGLVVVAVNHDLDLLYPELAESVGVQRCALDMLRVEAPLRHALPGPLLTGWSLIRYRGFADLSSAAAVRERLHAEQPAMAAFDVNQMYTQLPDGSLLVGDTHYRGVDASPFQPEEGAQLLLSEAATLFGTPEMRVLERWQGIYAAGPDEFLVAEPEPDVIVATVTTGIGMTTGLGLAEHILAARVDRAASLLKGTA